MGTTINAKRLRETLPDAGPRTELSEDALYRAAPVGRSRDGRSSTDHDTVLYGR